MNEKFIVHHSFFSNIISSIKLGGDLSSNFSTSSVVSFFKLGGEILFGPKHGFTFSLPFTSSAALQTFFHLLLKIKASSQVDT
jgi:hypothetical protein